MKKLALLAALATALVPAGCQYPRDPDGTLDRVEGGTMRVGVSAHEPWTRVSEGEPTGVEVTLVKQFAARLRAKIEWVPGSEEELIEALRREELDLVIGGLTHKSQWKKEVAFTRPYVEPEIVVGVPVGRPVPDDFDGMRVVVERGHEAGWLVERKLDARPVAVESLESARGRAAAVEEWLLNDLGLRRARRLKLEKIVMAVPMGENAWLVELERFLLNREHVAARLLEREGKP
jgi:polar amino acid transport system substrate-binding protein